MDPNTVLLGVVLVTLIVELGMQYAILRIHWGMGARIVALIDSNANVVRAYQALAESHKAGADRTLNRVVETVELAAGTAAKVAADTAAKVAATVAAGGTPGSGVYATTKGGTP